MNTAILLPFADASVLLAGIGLLMVAVGTVLTLSFVRHSLPSAVRRMPITVLKPLCGDEPLLEMALETFCRLDYPVFQLVLGVQDPEDPALKIVARLRARFPNVDIAVVVDPLVHGLNRKVSNLMNMLPSAKHDLLVFADSDLHVPPDYLARLGDALARPGVGLVTTLSAGRPGFVSLAATLGGLQINHCFLPSVLVSRAMGREDNLGTTMALQRSVLIQAGGLSALLGHLADDHVLGRRVQELGLSIALAPVITSTTVADEDFSALWAHELRWARTIGALEPLLFVFSTLQYPIFWASLALGLSGFGHQFVTLFTLVWTARAIGMLGVGYALRNTPGAGSAFMTVCACLLAPVRDCMSVAVVAVSYWGDRVTWRGHIMRADDGVTWTPKTYTSKSSS